MRVRLCIYQYDKTCINRRRTQGREPREKTPRLEPGSSKHLPGIVVVLVFTIEETQSPATMERHEVVMKVEVVPWAVCTIAEKVVMTVVEITVENSVRVGY